MTHKEIKMEHVFTQFAAFLRSWHRSGANETPVAGDTGERDRAGESVGTGGWFAKVGVRRFKL